MKINKIGKLSKNDSEKIFQLYRKYIDTVDNKEEIESSGTRNELAQDFIGDFICWLSGENKAAKYTDDFDDVNELMEYLDADGIPHSKQNFGEGKTTWYFDDGSFIEIQGDDITIGQGE